jgi:hypothetical protein
MYPCQVCGKDIGWDAPSGVCSEACLRKGQGFPVFDSLDIMYAPEEVPCAHCKKPIPRGSEAFRRGDAWLCSMACVEQSKPAVLSATTAEVVRGIRDSLEQLDKDIAALPARKPYYDRQRKDWICNVCDRVTDLCKCEE